MTERCDQCQHCGATRAAGLTGPHAVSPCPVLRREHEKRMEILEAELEVARQDGRPVVTFDASKLSADEVLAFVTTMAAREVRVKVLA